MRVPVQVKVVSDSGVVGDSSQAWVTGYLRSEISLFHVGDSLACDEVVYAGVTFLLVCVTKLKRHPRNITYDQSICMVLRF